MAAVPQKQLGRRRLSGVWLNICSWSVRQTPYVGCMAKYLSVSSLFSLANAIEDNTCARVDIEYIIFLRSLGISRGSTQLISLSYLFT